MRNHNKSRTFKGTILNSFRRVREDEDRFSQSIANSMIASTPVLFYDMTQFLEVMGHVYRTFFNNRDEAPHYSGRQKQVIAICQYVEQSGEVGKLFRSEDGEQGAVFLSDEEKSQYCDALCLLNGLERRQPDDDDGDSYNAGADYGVESHSHAVAEVGGEINLDLTEDDDSLVEDSETE